MGCSCSHLFRDWPPSSGIGSRGGLPSKLRQLGTVALRHDRADVWKRKLKRNECPIAGGRPGLRRRIDSERHLPKLPELDERRGERKSMTNRFEEGFLAGPEFEKPPGTAGLRLAENVLPVGLREDLGCQYVRGRLGTDPFHVDSQILFCGEGDQREIVRMGKIETQ